jgi:hypothetical protein
MNGKNAHGILVGKPERKETTMKTDGRGTISKWILVR